MESGVRLSPAVHCRCGCDVPPCSACVMLPSFAYFNDEYVSPVTVKENSLSASPREFRKRRELTSIAFPTASPCLLRSAHRRRRPHRTGLAPLIRDPPSDPSMAQHIGSASRSRRRSRGRSPAPAAPADTDASASGAPSPGSSDAPRGRSRVRRPDNPLADDALRQRCACAPLLPRARVRRLTTRAAGATMRCSRRSGRCSTSRSAGSSSARWARARTAS
jgi:hypothetical protein